MEECLFKTYYGDDCVDNVLSENQPRKKQNRIKSIVAASKNRGDILHETLQPLLDNHQDLKVKHHSNCANNSGSNQDPPSKQRPGQPNLTSRNFASMWTWLFHHLWHNAQRSMERSIYSSYSPPFLPYSK